MKRRGFTLVELLVVIVIISLLAALLLPAIARALCTGKQGATKHTIDQLTQATKNYELDQNAYPPGAGTGTATLVQALQSSGPKKLPYYEFQSGVLNPSGDVINGVNGTDILYYRNNAVNYPGNQGDPNVHNKTSFDIWGKDCKGANNGVNNWE